MGHNLTRITGDTREANFLFQRLSITIQHFNAVAFRSTFVTTDVLDEDVLDVDQMTSGGRFSGIDVTDGDNVDLLSSHDERLVSSLEMKTFNTL